LPQTEPQAATQSRQHHNAGRHWGTPFARGVDSKAQRLEERRRRIEAKARELAGEIGGFDDLPPFKRALLLKAAELLLEKRPADPVRTANALRQIYSALGLAVPKGRKLLRLPSR
jgi:hypothetical protein